MSSELPCNRALTSLRRDCRKCKEKMKCSLYVKEWKKKRRRVGRGRGM